MTDQEDEYNRALDEGRQRLDEQSWLEASESLQRACTLSPEAPEPNYLLGRALAGLGNWERAAGSFARTIELGGVTFEAWVGLGDALVSLDRAETAESAYGAAVALEPSHAETHAKLGYVLSRLGRIEAALEQYERAVELAPDLPDAHTEIGCLLLRLERWDDAVAALQRAVARGEEARSLQVQLGRALVEVGRPEDAEAAYRRAIAREPSWPQPQRLLGHLLADRGRWDEAAECYVRAVTNHASDESDGFETYFGGAANTQIVDIVLEVEHTRAYVRLADLLDSQGKQWEAQFVRSRAEALESTRAGSGAGPAGPSSSGDLSPTLAAAGIPSLVRIPRVGPDGIPYPTDKITGTPECLLIYEEFFSSFVDRPIRLLELGIYEGGSLLMWRDYFKLGTIVGLDVKAVRVPDDSGRIRVYQGYQEDIPLLDRIASEVAPAGYDIIIDDGSHRGDMTRISFDHLFYRHLKPGGIYVIEDWHTGYLSKWPDGSAYVPQADILETTEVGEPKHRLPSHDYGMVGFVKQLLDRYETFDRIIIAGKRVFVFKNAGSSGPVTPL